jgi:hypothetical protein
MNGDARVMMCEKSNISGSDCHITQSRKKGWHCFLCKFEGSSMNERRLHFVFAYLDFV